MGDRDTTGDSDLQTYKVVMVRHGESVYNATNRFTGWEDADLTDTGVEQAKQSGRLLRQAGYQFDIAFTSVLKRSVKTLYHLQEELDLHWIPVVRHWRLNEHMYGALTGEDKTESAVKYGKEQLHIWNRSYAEAPPAIERSDLRWPGHDRRYEYVQEELIPTTESLQDTLMRVLPFWYDNIVPAVLQGKRVLYSSHGNVLRALIYLWENMSNEDIMNLNIPNGTPLVYEFDRHMKPLKHYYIGSDETF